MSKYLTTGQMIDQLKTGEVAEDKYGNKVMFNECGVLSLEDGREVTLQKIGAQPNQWKIQPNYVSFEEAIAEFRNGKKIISYLDGHVYDTYQLSDIEEFEKTIELYEIINAVWTIED